MSRLSKAWHLPGPDKRLVVEAALLLAVARVSVRLVPFRHVHRLLSRPGRPAGRPVQVDLGRIEVALSRADRLFAGSAACLPRSIAGYLILRRRGWRPALELGVKRDDPAGSLAAHAWVTVGERLLWDNSAAVASFNPVMKIQPHVGTQ